MPPLIGVVPCRALADYLESIRRAGGEPWVLEAATNPVPDVMCRIRGLLLTGGGDVDPARYGEPRHDSVSGVDPIRDEYETALIHAARAADLPVFGICRGMQIINVALGGTLAQDLPTELPGSLGHSVTTTPCTMAHEVWVTRESRLWDLMQDTVADKDSCAVNSRHHQAVKKIAPGFEITATAPDGVSEAMELAGARFCLGVQWHPENFWRTGEFRPLFEGFVEACR